MRLEMLCGEEPYGPNQEGYISTPPLFTGEPGSSGAQQEFRSSLSYTELPWLGHGPIFLQLLVPHQSLASVPKWSVFDNHDGFCIDATTPPKKRLERNSTVFRAVGSILSMRPRELLPCFILKFVLFYPAFSVFLMSTKKKKKWRRTLTQFLKWYPCAIWQLPSTNSLLSFP